MAIIILIAIFAGRIFVNKKCLLVNINELKENTMRLLRLKRIISVLLIAVVITSYTIAATANTTDELEEAKNNKNNKQSEVDKVQNTLNQLAKDKSNLENYIKQLDQQAIDLDGRIYQMGLAIDEKQGQISQNEIKLSKAELDAEAQYISMKLRIQYMYEHQSESYIQLLLESDDVADMLNKAEYINKISSYDRQMLTEYESVLNLIKDTKVTLEKEYQELSDSKNQLTDQRAAVTLVANEKEAQMKLINSNTSTANSLKTKLNNELAEDEARIKAIEERIANENLANKNSGSGSTNIGNGQFMWPVPSSTRITSYFGWRVLSGVREFHKGIDIGAARPGVAGDRIVAAYPGEVVLTEYSSSAGNWVWIYHGNGLYTMYLHTSKILVSVGNKVNAGDVIALMGNTGASQGVHLDFRIRLNGDYVDPRSYLNY